LFLLFFFDGGRLAILKVFLLGGSFLFPRWDPSHSRVSITRRQPLRFKEGEVIRHMSTSLEMTFARCTAHLLAHSIDDPFLSEIGYPPHRREKEERGGAHAAQHLEEKKREWDEARRLKIGGIRRSLGFRWVLYDVHYRNESTLAAEGVQDGFVHKVFNAATVNGRVEWWDSILRTVELFDLANTSPYQTFDKQNTISAIGNNLHRGKDGREG
jgi:hypothetical protein